MSQNLQKLAYLMNMSISQINLIIFSEGSIVNSMEVWKESIQ